MTGQNVRQREPDAACRLCGTGLGGRHWRTRYCAPTCKAEAHRLAHILVSDDGDVSRYRSLAERLASDVSPGSALERLLLAADALARRNGGDEA